MQKIFFACTMLITSFRRVFVKSNPTIATFVCIKDPIDEIQQKEEMRSIEMKGGMSSSIDGATALALRLIK